MTGKRTLENRLEKLEGDGGGDRPVASLATILSADEFEWVDLERGIALIDGTEYDATDFRDL